MVVMTTQDVQVGWLLTGPLVILFAVCILIAVRSAWNSANRKADEDVTAPRFAHKLTDGVDEFQESWEQHVADALAKTEESNVVRLPGRRLRAIPEQGKPGALS